ncbi:MAG: EAL domain-containing protein [Campylobacterales bacterium]|nr:EAL domain-containing protein [Campylobacterales bacterium]
MALIQPIGISIVKPLHLKLSTKFILFSITTFAIAIMGVAAFFYHIQNDTFLLFSMLGVIILLFLAIIYRFYQKVLVRPLDILMHNIQHIQNRDYSYLQAINSHDELEEISQHMDTLAKNIQDKESELKYIAEHDSLTNLYNRYYFNHIINEKIVTIPEEYYLALIFIDVDEFKTINDTLGHDFGDQLLVAIARRLEELVSSQGNLSRIGGDEFMIILSKISAYDKVYSFAHRLQALFDEPFVIDKHYLKVTISFGIVLSNDRTKSVTTLYKEADLALYKAKEQGRNRFAFYKEEYSQELHARNDLLNGLKESIDNECDEFFLLYQPKISTQDGKTIMGVEALIRWNNRKLGIVPPDKFIGIAEESGLIIQLGYWIIQEACMDFLALKKRHVDVRQMSINISANQFDNKDFLRRVQEIIQRLRIDPANIEFELTERIIAHDNNDMLSTLDALRKLGIHIAIDDFGTGYSSLSYLSKLPVNRLKIDKSFVSNIDKADTVDIVQTAIVPLAKAFNLATTAEGVETKGEYEMLQKMGVDDIQGYYFAKPMNIDELERYYHKIHSQS